MNTSEKTLRESEEHYRLLVDAIPMPVWRCLANGELIDFNWRWYAYTGQSQVEARGHGWIKAVHPDDLPRTLERIKFVLATGEPYEVDYRLRAANGEYRWHSARGLPLKDSQGKVNFWFGCVYDIDDQKRAQELLAQRVRERTAALDEANVALQRANRALLAISRCGELLSRGIDESELLHEVCRIIVEIRGDRMAWVGFAEHDRKKTVRPVAQAGVDEGYLKRANITWAEHDPHGRGPTGTAIRTQNVVICRDIAVDPEFAPWRANALKRGYRAAIALPLVWQNQSMGALLIYSKETSPFHNEEVALLKQLAGDLTAGLVLLRGRAERERLQQELLQVTEREQRRIGQDLHDGLGQHLSAIAYLTSSLKKKLAHHPSAVTTETDRISKLLEEAIVQVRTLARGLHPIKEEGGLVAALAELAVTVRQLYKVSCRFDCRHSINLHNLAAATNLYRIAQEAVNNAVTHGKPTHIWIRLQASGGTLRLTIRNDGRSFPAKPRRTGMGLQTMQYRAKSIGATFTIVRNIRQGIKVVCSLPYAAATATGGPMPAEVLRKPHKTRIILVDDHPLLREGLAQRIGQEPDLEVCHQSGDAAQALRGIERLKPDLAIVDLTLPGRSGIELIKDLKALYPKLLVLVLTLRDESLYAERTLRAGAKGYVMKSAPPDDLIKAIRMVLKGELVLGPGALGQMMRRAATGRSSRPSSPMELLSDRELEIFSLLGQGETRLSIASDLRISVKTFEAHRANIRQKLGLRGSNELLQHAIRFMQNQETDGGA